MVNEQGSDLDTILASIKENEETNADALTEAIRPSAIVTSEPDPFIDSEPPKSDDGDDDDTNFDDSPAEADEDDSEFDDALGELQGALTLKEDMELVGQNYYGIPDLRKDMLVTRIPKPFDTWAGKDATPDDGKTHWLWNYGVAAFSGLPVDRATLSFFTYDEKFEGWWDHPAFYTAKAINNGIKQIVVPDFSFYDATPKAIHIFNAYRAQWMGRFFQEAGLKVMPRFQYCNKDSLDFCLVGIPLHAPVVITSIQNQKSNGPGKPLTDEEHTAVECSEIAMDKLKPKNWVVYGGPPAHRLYEDGHVTVPSGINVVLLKNYAWQRRGTVFDKKEGLGTSKEKSLRSRAKKAKQAEAVQDEE